LRRSNGLSLRRNKRLIPKKGEKERERQTTGVRGSLTSASRGQIRKDSKKGKRPCFLTVREFLTSRTWTELHKRCQETKNELTKSMTQFDRQGLPKVRRKIETAGIRVCEGILDYKKQSALSSHGPVHNRNASEEKESPGITERKKMKNLRAHGEKDKFQAGTNTAGLKETIQEKEQEFISPAT